MTKFVVHHCWGIPNAKFPDDYDALVSLEARNFGHALKLAQTDPETTTIHMIEKGDILENTKMRIYRRVTGKRRLKLQNFFMQPKQPFVWIGPEIAWKFWEPSIVNNLTADNLWKGLLLYLQNYSDPILQEWASTGLLGMPANGGMMFLQNQ